MAPSFLEVVAVVLSAKGRQCTMYAVPLDSHHQKCRLSPNCQGKPSTYKSSIPSHERCRGMIVLGSSSTHTRTRSCKAVKIEVLKLTLRNRRSDRSLLIAVAPSIFLWNEVYGFRGTRPETSHPLRILNATKHRQLSPCMDIRYYGTKPYNRDVEAWSTAF